MIRSCFQRKRIILTDISGLALLPLLHGDSILAVTVVASAEPREVLSVAAIDVSVVSVLLVAATALPLRVVETILRARMTVAATATVVIEIVIGTTTTAAALVAQPTVSVIGKTVTAGKMTAMLQPATAMTVKVRLTQTRKLLSSTPTTSSCPGTSADTRLSSGIPSTCSR